MKTNTISLFSNGISYDFTKEQNKLLIQIYKLDLIDSFKLFTYDQLVSLSSYFALFDDIQSIFNVLVSHGKKEQITLVESTDSYQIQIINGIKEAKPINIVIPKKASKGDTTVTSSNSLGNKTEVSITPLEHQLNATALTIDSRFRALEYKIDQQFVLLGKKIDCHFEELMKVKSSSAISRKRKEIAKKSHHDNDEEEESKEDEEEESCPYLGFLSKEETNMVLKWIGDKKHCEYILLSRPTQGNEKAVMKKCNGIPSLLVLIESKEGWKFGGYTSKGWNVKHDDKAYYSADSQAFLFSIDKKSKYTIQKPLSDTAMCNSIRCPFCFYDAFYLKRRFMSSDKNWVYLKRYGLGQSLHEINGGEYHFSIKQMFVYQIKF